MPGRSPKPIPKHTTLNKFCRSNDHPAQSPYRSAEARAKQQADTASKFVSYFRVSTDRQGVSGLGLDAPREAVHQFLAGRVATGCTGVIAEFVEIESGSKNDRPQLALALEACRKNRATLLIAKLNRLARNVAFISALMEGYVEFVAADNPHASRLMLHLLVAFAEHERQMISQRTKAALAASEARGVKLGINGAGPRCRQPMPRPSPMPPPSKNISAMRGRQEQRR